jgi:uncharacterized protein
MSQEAFQKATGTQDKELFLVDGATHTFDTPFYILFYFLQRHTGRF